MILCIILLYDVLLKQQHKIHREQNTTKTLNNWADILTVASPPYLKRGHPSTPSQSAHSAAAAAFDHFDLQLASGNPIAASR